MSNFPLEVVLDFEEPPNTPSPLAESPSPTTDVPTGAPNTGAPATESARSADARADIRASPPSTATPAASARAAPSPPPSLRGGDQTLGRGPLAIVEGLLRTPAAVLSAVQRRDGVLFQLSALVVVSMVVSGLVMAAFSGGLQLLVVPLKLSVGIFFCALICFPSLYIFSSLAGAQQSLRETWGALLMGVALIGILLVGFAPVSWVFSQATSSTAFMGGLHLVFLLISSYFGLGLIRRALAAANGKAPGGTTLWSLLFLLVVFQMTTTLRPLVGEFDGELFHEKQFFLAHWFESLG